tara:strand:- start:6000 stop:6173 length:174 start_codon:yes stop_codon:yes gene_type:complete
MQLGYILVVVWFLGDGTVTGEAIDHYYDAHECWQNAVWSQETADPGKAYTCVPETAE